MVKAPDFARQMMSSPAVHVAPDNSVADALRAMIDRDIGAVVVVEDGRSSAYARSATSRERFSTIHNCWFVASAT
jgi:CBS domain-containing protein